MTGELVARHSDDLKPDKVSNVKITFLTGEQRGQFFIVNRGERITIGRSQNCNVTIDDTKISREHAEFVWYHESLIITDLKSQNGIIVNDKKVLQAEVQEGDRIIIGKNVLKVGHNTKNTPSLDFSKEDLKEELQSGKNKNKSIVGILVLLVLVYLLIDDSGTPEQKIQKNATREIDSESSVADKIERKELKKTKKLDKKVSIVLHRGLRELREKNYFRAISEFNYALDLNPQDPQANFYLRKAKDELDKAIQQYSIDAKRDIASLKYKKGIVSYCSIVRLLQKYPEDTRYINAKKNIEDLEVDLGYEQGEIICIQE